MQAAGLVNDHTLGCFRRTQVAGARGRAQSQAVAASRAYEAVAQAAPAEQHVGGQHRELATPPRRAASSARTPSGTAVAP